MAAHVTTEIHEYSHPDAALTSWGVGLEQVATEMHGGGREEG